MAAHHAPTGTLDSAAAALRGELEAVPSRELADEARERFLRAHVRELYAELTSGLAEAVRIEELLRRAAEHVPGLVPDEATLSADAARPQAEKEGVEIAQGLFLAHVLALPREGLHLVWSMLRPTAAAIDRLEEFRASGAAQFEKVHVRREGSAGIVELRNPRHLNAEDDSTLADTETAVDLVLLDPEIEVGVIRGGVLEHPRYAGRRIFGAGINLTLLYQGRISYLFYLVRDLGYVNKLYRGLSSEAFRPDEPEQTTEKLWIAVAETYAIGGACQLLHVVDHVLAERGCRLYLPARKEGIIPGASDLRLRRSVGDRIARQAILSGREFVAGEPDGELLCDEVVEPGEIDEALTQRIEALTSSGLINAAANRRAMRVGEEPLDSFRAYMASYAREQAYCHFSPALIANLERDWKAHQRRV